MVKRTDPDDSLDDAASVTRLRFKALVLALFSSGVGLGVLTLGSWGQGLWAGLLALGLGAGLGFLYYREFSRLQDSSRSARAKALTSDITKAMLTILKFFIGTGTEEII